MEYQKYALVKTSFVFVLVAMLLVPIVQAFSFTNGQNASLVLGKSNFTTNSGAGGASGINSPRGINFDSSGNLWVADIGNHRVLRYDAPFTNGEAATLVLGSPDFVTGGGGPPTDSSLFNPRGTAFDSSGNLWVADTNNHRVLRYDAPFTNGEAATLVLGQSGFTTNAQGTPATASSLAHPTDVDVDSSGNLWVTDFSSNRLLRYDAPFTNGQAATLVLGQPDFVSSAGPNPPTASSLAGPNDIDVDSSGNLWVTESFNNRLLRYDAPFTNGEAATLVLGQPDFVSNAVPASPTASSLAGPEGVAVSGGSTVLVTDTGNHRVLRYDAPFTNGEAATLVLGQSGFTTNAFVSPPTASSLSFPRDVSSDSIGNIWVADTGNNRVLMYAATVSGSQVPGQVTIAGTCGLAVVSGSPINYGTLVPSTTSSEQTLVLDNTGSIQASLTVKGTHWIDSSSNTQMNVGNTKFSTTTGTYASKTALTTSDQSVGTISPSPNLNTYWQLQANLLDSSFSGSLTQTVDFTASC